MRKPSRQSFFIKDENSEGNRQIQPIRQEDKEAELYEEAITDFTTSIARHEL